MTFSLEIGYRLNIRDATHLPGALDTTYETIIQEDRESIFESIADSMATKCALSLVSKDFHDLAEEYLYEIVTFHRIDRILSAMKYLRTSRNGISSGMLCRRLDIYLGIGIHGDGYGGEDWEDSAILWGLLPSCPNISVFIFHGWYTNMFILWHDIGGPLVPSVALWQMMAKMWASTLRRIELSGIWMRADPFGLFI